MHYIKPVKADDLETTNINCFQHDILIAWRKANSDFIFSACLFVAGLCQARALTVSVRCWIMRAPYWNRTLEKFCFQDFVWVFRPVLILRRLTTTSSWALLRVDFRVQMLKQRSQRLHSWSNSLLGLRSALLGCFCDIYIVSVLTVTIN